MVKIKIDENNEFMFEEEKYKRSLDTNENCSGCCFLKARRTSKEALRKCRAMQSNRICEITNELYDEDEDENSSCEVYYIIEQVKGEIW